MAEPAIGKDEANPVFWLATQSWPLGICCIGPPRKSSLFHHIINPSLTKLVWSWWLDIGLVLFYVFIDLDFVTVSKNARLATIWPHKLKQVEQGF